MIREKSLDLREKKLRRERVKAKDKRKLSRWKIRRLVVKLIFTNLFASESWRKWNHLEVVGFGAMIFYSNIRKRFPHRIMSGRLITSVTENRDCSKAFDVMRQISINFMQVRRKLITTEVLKGDLKAISR